jgi:hypothetical protein
VSAKNDQKLKNLLDRHLPRTVLLASWLEAQGISRSLQARYRQSGWLASIGTGAFRRPNENVTWEGALYALQAQAAVPIHAGALTALAAQGFSHYLRLGRQTLYLFSPRGTKLPAWFKQHDWGLTIRHLPTSFLPPDLGLADHDAMIFTIRVSTPERAMLECLHLAPKELDLVECLQVMEGLANLRPQVVQELLIACRSIKVKRLFLYLAERASHQWLQFVDTSVVDLGKGERSLSEGGVYVAKYNLVVPRELAAP